jgi:hypothetical protein
VQGRDIANLHNRWLCSLRILISDLVRKEKNREVNVPMPRFYFFFAGAFFLTGFFATKITSGFNI